jgi:hypothetical protein
MTLAMGGKILKFPAKEKHRAPKYPAVVTTLLGLLYVHHLKSLQAAQTASTGEHATVAMAYAEGLAAAKLLVVEALEMVRRKPGV